MAASERQNRLHISVESLSTVGSLRSRTSSNEYSEDFDSSSHSSRKEMGRKASGRGEVPVNGVDDVADLTAFLQKKIDVLKENIPSCITRPTEHKQKSSCPQNSEEFSRFLFEKLKILRKRTADRDEARQLKHKDGFSFVSEDTLRKDKRSVSPERAGDEIGCFQSAFERIKFENLRFKSRKFIESDIHCTRTCRKCKTRKQKLSEVEFYRRWVQTVQHREVDQRFERHLQTTSSATLIAKIIESGPKPSWNSNELWDKLLAGGFQGVKPS